MSFWPVQKDISGSDAPCFVFLTASKRHFGPGCSVFCLFGRFKKTFRTRVQLVLSFWQVQKDISSLDTVCFVFLTASKRHFGPGCSLFCLFGRFKKTFRARVQRVCPFGRFKKTFRARMQRVLSFWPVQKDISSLGAACFVLLAGSKGHFEPGCNVFCLVGRFKKTFRAWVQRVLSFWRFQKDILGLDTACFVLLTASKRHFGPGCNVFCPFGRFKKTFRARMQRVLSF